MESWFKIKKGGRRTWHPLRWEVEAFGIQLGTHINELEVIKEDNSSRTRIEVNPPKKVDPFNLYLVEIEPKTEKVFSVSGIRGYKWLWERSKTKKNFQDLVADLMLQYGMPDIESYESVLGNAIWKIRDLVYKQKEICITVLARFGKGNKFVSCSIFDNMVRKAVEKTLTEK